MQSLVMMHCGAHMMMVMMVHHALCHMAQHAVATNSRHRRQSPNAAQPQTSAADRGRCGQQRHRR